MPPRDLIRSIGDIMQLAFVPKDFDATLVYWTKTMGVGPFYMIPNAGLQNINVDGEPSEFEFGLAIAYWGNLQVELIKPLKEPPSFFAARSEPGPDPLHHICLVTDDIAHARNVTKTCGGQMRLSATTPAGGGVFYAQFDQSDALIEVLELSDAGREIFNFMKNEAANWDGSDPLRTLN